LAAPKDRLATAAEATPQGRYPRLRPLVLTFVYVANFIDRQFLSILNEEIKRVGLPTFGSIAAHDLPMRCATRNSSLTAQGDRSV
jgi:hypothetical protein